MKFIACFIILALAARELYGVFINANKGQYKNMMINFALFCAIAFLAKFLGTLLTTIS